MKNTERLPIFQPLSRRTPLGYDGEGGAGAGAGGGAGAGEEKLTLAQVNDLVNRTVNNAMAALKKTDLPKIIETAVNPLSTQLTSISETLTTLSAGGSGGQGGSGSGSGVQGGGQGSGQGGQGTAARDPETNALLKQLESTVKKQGDSISGLQKEKDEANKRAEAAEKNSVVRGVLGELTFASPAALETAFSLVNSHVRKQDDGSYVGGVNGDDLPLSDFVKEFVPKSHAYLLKPTGGSGSGAGSGSPGNVNPRTVDMSVIRPGMKPEERQAVYAAIAAAVPQN